MLSGSSIVEPRVIAVHTPTTVVCKMTMTITCNVIFFAAGITCEAIMRVVIVVVTIIVHAVAVAIAIIGV